jgi:beta-alanine--pyruvate transaminase
MEPYWRAAVHSLKDARHVIDIRDFGLIAGIELEPRPGAPTARAMAAFETAFDKGLLIRVTGDIIALSPPLIIEKAQVDQVVETIRAVLSGVE